MPRYASTLRSPLPPEAVWAYMAAFDNIRHWDPLVVDARRVDAGPLVVGSEFEVVVRVARRPRPLRYRITALEPGRLLRLEAPTRTLRSVDTITVAVAPGGSTLTYDARLVLTGPWRLAGPFLQRWFDRVGEGAEEGLARALEARP